MEALRKFTRIFSGFGSFRKGINSHDQKREYRIVNAMDPETEERGALIGVEDSEISKYTTILGKAFVYVVLGFSIMSIPVLAIILIYNFNDLTSVIISISLIIIFSGFVIFAQNNFHEDPTPRLPIRLFENGVEIPRLYTGGIIEEEPIYYKFSEIEDLKYADGMGVIYIRNGNTLVFPLPPINNVLKPGAILEQWEKYQEQLKRPVH